MNKYLYTAGAFTFALALGGLSAAVAYAEDTATGEVKMNTETAVTAVPTNVGAPIPVRVSADAKAEMMKRVELEMIAKKRALLASTSVQLREVKQERRAELDSNTDGVVSEQEREQLKQKTEQIREETKQQVEQRREEVKQQVEQARETFKNRIELIREGTTTPARSLEQLKRIIEERRAVLADETASTTPETRKILDGVAPMRVAIHALLASRELLGGGIGQRVSDIAREVDDSAATTTNAEAKIQSRGFLTRLLFGGDKQAAGAISGQVAENQDRMQTLTGLLSDASTDADVKAELEAQIKAIRDEQTRLQDVAQSQKKLWGLFSWRF